MTEIATALGLETSYAGRITGFSVDTRTIAPGDLFFALQGPNHDGNAYVDAAFEGGAAAAVVTAGAELRNRGAILAVPDTLAALQRAARWARDQWNHPVIGVTGSAGKTSTKDIIAAMLSVSLCVGKTIGNLNNHVGVPLSILRLPADSEAAVLELAMNHTNEIRELCKIARPDIGVVTNVGHAHVEAFDSIEGVAAAKRELIESLPPEGIAVLNADDPLVSQFSRVHFGRSVTFGLNPGAGVRAEDIELRETGVRFRVRGVPFESPLVGRHSILNLLAGIAVAELFGIAPEQLTGVASALTPGNMRGERLEHDGILILNDCYNSNPDAARAMIDVLRETPARRRIAVLGEMLELGRWAEPLHREVGRYVAESGIDVLVGIRGAARFLVDAARGAGQSVGAAFFFSDSAEAGDFLRTFAHEGDAILFKGSRGTHVERALERLVARPN